MKAIDEMIKTTIVVLWGITKKKPYPIPNNYDLNKFNNLIVISLFMPKYLYTKVKLSILQT